MTNLLLSLLTAVARRTKANFMKKLARPKPCKSSSCATCYWLIKILNLVRNIEIKTIDRFREQIPISPTARPLLIALPGVRTTFSQPIQLSI